MSLPNITWTVWCLQNCKFQIALWVAPSPLGDVQSLPNRLRFEAATGRWHYPISVAIQRGSPYQHESYRWISTYGIKLPLYLLAGWFRFPLISFSCHSQNLKPHHLKPPCNSQASTPPNEVALRNSFRAVGNALAAASVDNSKAKQPPKPVICWEATSRALAKEGCCTAWIKPNSTLSIHIGDGECDRDGEGLKNLECERCWMTKTGEGNGHLRHFDILTSSLSDSLVKATVGNAGKARVTCPELSRVCMSQISTWAVQFPKGKRSTFPNTKPHNPWKPCQCADFYNAIYIYGCGKNHELYLHGIEHGVPKSMPKPRIFGGLL